jgi:uncharacterized protein YndB with AHSA1/START domain
MELKFKVFAHVSRPSHEVFEAVADPARLSGYFTTGGAEGRLEVGSTVTWDFADFPGRFPVDVVEVVPDRRIVLLWDGNEGGGPAGYKTRVTMEFSPLDEDTRTMVAITEEGWDENQAGLDASYGNCMGWSQMLAALKVYVEHGFDLREGMYK